jgi:hypothetical protein
LSQAEIQTEHILAPEGKYPPPEHASRFPQLLPAETVTDNDIVLVVPEHEAPRLVYDTSTVKLLSMSTFPSKETLAPI